MGLPKGTNNGNHGAPGRSGRKSAYQENADAALLREMFVAPMSREEVQAKLKSGKYSLKDLFVSKGYAGNERVLLALFNKNFPDDLLTMESRMADVDSKPEEVKSVEDVMNLIEATINGVQSGAMSVKAATNVGRLASLALKAIEVGELNQKLDLINSVVLERKARLKK